MVSIMTAGDAHHARRCDRRCYDGKPTTRCKCICGGAHHAQGLEGAQKIMRDKLLGEVSQAMFEEQLGEVKA